MWSFFLRYSDEWCELKDSRGKRIGHFRAFYICLAGGASDPCKTLMLSDAQQYGYIHTYVEHTFPRFSCYIPTIASTSPYLCGLSQGRMRGTG